VDGVYGGMTEYAVIRFQQNQGLNPDGVVGPATASALGLGYSGGGVGSGGIGGGIGGGGGFGVGEVVTIATNGSPLNVRSGPGLDYGVIYTLPFGAVAPVTGRRVGGWIQLADGGWVSSSWVR
jgi:peptidoglycan hydrolase-like protein with peptidoglycan-binding domain